MFKWRIISRSNINGKVHSFQKDFDDYDAYHDFVERNPEYSPRQALIDFWNPWSVFDRSYPTQILGSNTPVDSKYLPEWVDLWKYENRRLEKRQTEAENLQKKYSLERSKVYLEEYLGENPDDTEAKADLDKIQSEIKLLG